MTFASECQLRLDTLNRRLNALLQEMARRRIVLERIAAAERAYAQVLAQCK